MNEIVLGLGHQASLWTIVQLADQQLRSIHGSPKRMVVRSGNLTVEAHRLNHNAFAARSAAISLGLKPNSFSTSLVCWPRSGGGTAILLLVRDSDNGWPTPGGIEPFFFLKPGATAT